MHHMHIWQLNEKENHLEAHVDFHTDITLSEFDNILDQMESILCTQFGINHEYST